MSSIDIVKISAGIMRTITVKLPLDLVQHVEHMFPEEPDWKDVHYWRYCDKIHISSKRKEEYEWYHMFLLRIYRILNHDEYIKNRLKMIEDLHRQNLQQQIDTKLKESCRLGIKLHEYVNDLFTKYNVQ